MEAGGHCFSHGACGVDGAGGKVLSRRQGSLLPAPLWDNQVKEELGAPNCSTALGGGKVQMQEGQGATPSEGAGRCPGRKRLGGRRCPCFLDRRSLQEQPGERPLLTQPGQNGNLEGGRGVSYS